MEKYDFNKILTNKNQNSKMKKIFSKTTTICCFGFFFSLLVKIQFGLVEEVKLPEQLKNINWIIIAIIRTFLLFTTQLNLLFCILSYFNYQHPTKRKTISILEFNISILGISMIFIYFNFMFIDLWKRYYWPLKEIDDSKKGIEIYLLICWLIETTFVHFINPIIFVYSLLKTKKLRLINFEDVAKDIFWKKRTLFYPLIYFVINITIIIFLLLNFPNLELNKMHITYDFMTQRPLVVFYYLSLFIVIAVLSTFFFVIINNFLYYKKKIQNNDLN